MSFIYRYRLECPPVPRCSREVLQKLIELLPPVEEMRKAGSPACEVYETTQLSHICVVDSNPRSRHFGVLFHMCPTIDYRDTQRRCKYIERTTVQMSAPNREILARFAASLRGHQDGGLLYVGALRELYERDNLPIPGGLDFGQGGMVGFEISIYLQEGVPPMSLFIAASLVDDASGGQHLEYQVNQPIVEDILRCYGEDSLPLQRLVSTPSASWTWVSTPIGGTMCAPFPVTTPTLFRFAPRGVGVYDCPSSYSLVDGITLLPHISFLKYGLLPVAVNYGAMGTSGDSVNSYRQVLDDKVRSIGPDLEISYACNPPGPFSGRMALRHPDDYTGEDSTRSGAGNTASGWGDIDWDPTPVPGWETTDEEWDLPVRWD